jgi:hypothetical protein
MNQTFIVVGKIICVLFFVACCFWYYTNRDWESFSGVLAALGGLVALFIVENRTSQTKPISQNQKSGNNSTNYQAGGDIKINSTRND